MKRDLNMPIKALKNVGPAREAALKKMGAESVLSLLRLYPRSYENRGDVKRLDQTENGEKSALCLTVATAPKRALIKRGMSLLKFRAYDESAVAEVTYFNQDYLAEKFVLGESYRFYGRIERIKKASGKDSFSLSSPAAEQIKESVSELRPLIPIYPLTKGLSQNIIGKLVGEALSIISASGEEDPLPSEIQIRNKLCGRSFALRNIHSPETFSDLAAAKKRLIFEEFFYFALGIAVHGKKRTVNKKARVCNDREISPLLSLLPYSLTAAQQSVIEEISADMAKEAPMGRLLVGDVGCGKTVCAAAAMYIAVKNGMQAALMAPTEILATQHYKDLEPLFSELGIKTRLLTGSLSPLRKRKIYESLVSKGEERTDVVIGTHALISEGVSFDNLGLVITDEQHRFGVKQRAALGDKGRGVHMLVMSATPIPRSLALTLYGDLELSMIKEMPPGRQKVDTFAVDEGYRERINAFIEKLTGEGGQVYVVCPAVEEKKEDDEGDIRFLDIPLSGDIRDKTFEKKEAPPLKSAVKYSEELSLRFPKKTVAFVHGKMKAAEKDDVMRRFAIGEVDILVSTTVIEVGVNVPNACLMIVENAERFGLSQLHQLRGRVGRGTRKSYCILVSDSRGEKAAERLSIMKNTYDGFVIAEKDLAMRGPGDFVENAGGIRQSGELSFRLADMCNDGELLEGAFSAARELIKASPDLSMYPAIKNEIETVFDMGNKY